VADPLHSNPEFAGPGNRTIDAGAENSDSTDLSLTVRQLWNTTGGALAVKVIAAGDADSVTRTITIPGTDTVPSGGVWDRFYVRRILATGTASGAKVAGAIIGIL
jgi:hypothetical protein